MTRAQKEKRDREVRRLEDAFAYSWVLGLYSWEDYPEAHNACRCKVQICKATLAGALLSGYRLGRAARNYTQ